MFSADAPSHNHSLRSKRTRQTTGNEESVKLPATKKRRSALRRDTFEPLTESSLNEIAGREKPTTKQNGHIVEPESTHSRNTSQSRELTLRGGKKSEKRTEKGGGLFTLSTNEYYTVSQLPALPEQIRSRPGVAYSCVISPESDYILALTHTDALVWPYNTSSSTPSSRELLSFKLPFPPASTNDPLPLAAFTAKSANGESGIIALSPKWGKIVYWESLTSASTFIPGQTTNGLQGSIPGILNGETVKGLISAEPAGFIATFSHGRVAQITVRDQLGRPNIGVQWLRKSSANTARGGLFGSIRNILTSDRRKGTPLVRAGKSAKAQRDVVVCTEEGEIEFWSNNLSIGNSLTKALSVREHLLEALQSQVAHAQGDQSLRLKILDFSLSGTPTSSHELAKHGDHETSSFTFLISVCKLQETRFFVIDSVISGDNIIIKALHPIRRFPTEIKSSADWRPRLCMTTPQSPAFIVFERAVVLMSLARITETPSSQLLGDRAALPEPFQDCIAFQEDTLYKIINYAGEVHDDSVACVFAVQGFGIVRITSHLQNTDEVDVEDVESEVSAKSRIEQAIFFGTKKSNPLELRKAQETYVPEQIRLATVQISQEILSSKCKYLPKSSSSIDDHLKQRARALQDLAEHVLRYYPNSIPRDVRFWLLFQSEKLAAAQALWKVQQNIQQTYPRKDDREMTYLNFVLRALHESRQKYPKPEKGETDHVRHWLIYSVYSIDHLLTELESCLQDLSHMDINDPRIICDYLTEALDLWIAAYRAAFKFREDNASIYGLGDEVYQDGVLTSGYPPDVQPWTSNKEPLRFAQDLIADVCRYLQDWWNYEPSAQTNGSSNTKNNKQKQVPRDVDGKPYEAPSRDSLDDLANRLPDQVELFYRILKENNIQDQSRLKANPDLDPEQKERQLKQLKGDIRPIIKQAIEWIAPFNREGSIALAEDISDTALLVDLNLAYLADLAREAIAHPDQASAMQRKVNEVQEHVETYFDRFGNDWAYAHFSSLIERGEVGRMLAEAQAEKGKKQPYLSWFLDRSSAVDQQLGKISWINDVIGEGDYTRARTTLEQVADIEETDIWSRKTEVCLAKLAGLAALEDKASTFATQQSKQQESNFAGFDRQLQYLEVQEALSIHINAALADAIDDQAAFDLAVETFIPKPTLTTKKASSQRKYLTTLLMKIIQNEVLTIVELVDALTLLQIGEFRGDQELADDPMVADQEFALALRAIDLQARGNMSEHDSNVLRTTVWRRLLTRDDWTKLNDTSGKNDEEVKVMMMRTMLMKTLLVLFDAASKDGGTVDIPAIEDLLKTSPNAPVAGEAGEDGAEDYSEKVSDEAKAEIKQLKIYIDKARLAEHYSGLIKEAQRAVRDFRNQEASSSHQQQQDEMIVQSVEEDGPA